MTATEPFRPGWWDAVPVVARTLKGLYPQNPDVVLGREARTIVQGLHDAGLVIIPDEPDHFVTFDANGWFIEHSIACRVAGTLGTCVYNAAIREIADEPDPDQFGRWRITDIDSEGLPSLERAEQPAAVAGPGHVEDVPVSASEPNPPKAGR